MNRLRFVLYCLPLALASLCSSVFGQEPPAERRTMTALRLEESERIVLDGVLDEGVWQRAEPAKDFIQQDPDNGRPATERTEVRIVFNRQRLYLGVICFDSEPDKLIGYQRRRDEGLGSDDRFQWTIDTYLNARSGYFFEINPSGLMADALMGERGARNRQWDGIWTAKVIHSEVGWTAEIEIPFQTLNFAPEAEAWGINFLRTVRRKNEDSLWMGYARNQGLLRLANAGLLKGIREMSQGKGLDFKPYVTGTAFSAPGRGQTDTVYTGDLGLDVTYTPSPRLRASLTVNTDFAQTEVDQRQVNLTRFSLFFPERRGFFLEGANFFDFRSDVETANNLRLLPYFSRRIGLNASAQPQPIVFGTKLTGQVGQQDLGIFFVRTGRDATSAGEDFSVVRLKRRVLAQSYIGGLFTRRDPREAGQARSTVGLDMLLATSNFRGSYNLEFGAFMLGASNPTGQTGENLSYGFNLNYPNDPWEAYFDFREVRANFDPAIGFVSRTDYRRFLPSLKFSPRPQPNRWIRNFAFGATLDVLTDTGGEMLTREFALTVFEVELRTQDVLTLTIKPEYQRLRPSEGSSISGIDLPAGSEYSFTRYGATLNTASRRTVAVQSSVEWGPFYSGRREQYTFSVNLRARPGVIVYSTAEYNRVRLAEGSVQTRLFRVTPEFQLSPWMAFVNTFQYDSVSRVLGWQSRFRWIVKPGNDFFFVYTHNWTDDPIAGFATLERRASTKVIYTHRF